MFLSSLLSSLLPCLQSHFSLTATKEELLQRFSNLLKGEDKEENIPMQSEIVVPSCNLSLCMIEKLLSRISINAGGLKAALTKAWCPEGLMEFIEVGKNVFLVTFENEHDKRQVLGGSPWTFSRDLFVIDHFQPNQPVEKWTFSQCDFWVQLYGLPLEYLANSTAKKLANKTGSLSSIGALEDTKWAKFIRISIRVDMTNVLVESLLITLLNGSLVEVQVKYECLTCYCVFCGCINHELQECPQREKMESKMLRIGSIRDGVGYLD
ncbi:uncharacterized protein At4g02000-like [Typha angustifolia]|uniref:uncharacterized protein At4g02000-like n=1 Tax=Typha angustifolia TaxID=59011 RepID=UPI003C2C14C9